MNTQPNPAVLENSENLTWDDQLKPGDKCQYGFKREWQEGILVEFWNPQYPHLQTYTPNFSYFTVNVGGKIKKGYGLHQLRI